MVGLDRDVLGLFDVKHRLEYGQPVPDTADAHCLEVFMLQGDEGLADNFVFLSEACQSALRVNQSVAGVCSPMKMSAYCCRPMLAMKSAHSSAVHSDMMVSGRRSALER